MPPIIHHRPSPAERAAELAAIEQAVQREIRWIYARTVVLCLLWLAIALVAIGWAVHSTNEQEALIAFWGGMLVGNAGILITLLVTYQRAIEAGLV